MTEITDTTNRDIEKTARREGAILDLGGVKALLGIIAWAEDSMPVELAGETRRLAFMLLEQTMGQALKDLDTGNEETERDKAGPEPAKPEPTGPQEALRDYIDRRVAEQVPKHLDSIRDSLAAITDRMGGQAHG